MVRIHNVPRKKLFSPEEETTDPIPVELKDIDVLRITKTSSNMADEKWIEDVWLGETANRELSEEWVGETTFVPNPPEAPKGSMWISGRLVRLQKTTRPDDVWPEVWLAMSKKQKQEARARWEIKSKMI